MQLGKFHVVLGAAALTALPTGCIAFKGEPTAKQIKKKPKVAVKFTACESNGGDCPNGNSGAPSGGDVHVLVGLRVPKGTKVPQRFTAKEVRASGTTSNELVKDASYKRELNQKAPKGSKFKYFGYLSEEPADATGDKEADFKVKLGVPEELVGKKFKVLPVIGWTVADPGEVDCGDDVFGPGTNSFCIDYPLRDELKNIKVKVKPKK